MRIQQTKILLAALFVTAAIGARAHQSIGWSECACDTNTYSLTVNDMGHGTASVPPFSTGYTKGEWVAVSFTPNADRVFSHWSCTPASHLASESLADSVMLFITGDTTLTAYTFPKNYTLGVTWNNDRGTVSLPQGAQGGSNFFTMPVEYGQQLSLSATPNAGYFTVWQGQWAQSHWSGQRYGNSVNVKVQGNVYLSAGFKPQDEYPETMHQLTVNLSGGSAETYAAGAADASWNAGPYPYSTATGPARFSFSIVPAPGYFHKYITWVQGGLARYMTNGGIQYRFHNTYTAHLVKEAKLNIEIDGEGVVTSPHFQYSWNPEPYNPQGLTSPPATSLTPMVNANYVSMTPSPCPGWLFDHWEYTDASGETVVVNNPIPGFPMPLTVYMNWWSGAGVRLPNGKEIMDVKAVFAEACPCGAACYPADFNLSPYESQLVQALFPNISLCNVFKTAESSPVYNCIAFVGGETTRWVWAEIDELPYGNQNGQFERHEFVNYFNARGVTDYLIYGFSQSNVEHAARFNGACAESKLGPNILLRHNAEEMEGGVYGYILPETP